jgi:hypothetical protein
MVISEVRCCTVEGRAHVDLGTTFGIHNTSRDMRLILERIDYPNPKGQLIQAYLSKPIALRPFGTVEMFGDSGDIWVAQAQASGSSGRPSGRSPSRWSRQ